MNQVIYVETSGQGMIEITQRVKTVIQQSGIKDGLCTVFICHTSCSLVIQENADPSAQRDLESWLNRLVPENDPLYTHTFEGADDMPAHIKSALTATSLSIPAINGELVLGTWQGLFLWEHRHQSQRRKIVVNVSG
ncbi:secondary thiamine-phosphate synthase enzyme YjbQ [Pleionea sediminis]|uniref:secondary thiamine-phosphate synthase enzyme YjbQ n=1 Tax=Pleionea sediminis TaxID=2569479 RepID=UPI001185C516|nr:secondary thiamine-phosphate synthase enzyme YjbQ [Pleionea sediminis]